MKCKTQYRQLISKLNNKLNTVQIKQCSKEWSKIDFENVTSVTLNKNYKCFLNDKEIHDKDRVKCQENFKNFILQCKQDSNTSNFTSNLNSKK